MTLSHLLKFCLLIIALLFPLIGNAHQQDENNPQLEPVTLQLKWLYQFQFAGYIAAKEKGFYADEGLNVTLKEKRPDINVIDEVQNGNAEYGIAGMGLLSRYANGDNLRAMAAIFQHDATVLISRADSDIISPYELAGKRIMFDSTTGSDAIIRALLHDSEVKLDDIKLVPQSFNFDKLINGEIDVMSGYITSQPFQLRRKGIEVNIINPHNYGYDFYGDLLFASHTELHNHPDRVQRMLRASLKGWHYALAHPDEIIHILKTKYHSSLSQEELAYESRETRKLIAANAVPIGTIHSERLRRIADIYQQLDLAPALSDTQLENFIYRQSQQLSFTPKEQAWLASHPVIRVGADRDFAPYEWLDGNGNYAGLASEYIKLLEKKLGVRFEIVADKPWPEIVQMAYDGELDMLSCINRTTERSKHLLFSAPFVSNPIVLVNANRNGYIGSLEQLKGKTIAIENGYYTHETLKNDYPDIKLLIVDSTEQALKKVESGEADAYVGDAAYANYAIRINGFVSLQFAGQVPWTSAYRMGINKTQPELYSLVNKVLANISQDELKLIEQQWMGLTIISGNSWRTIFQFSIAFSILLLLFSYWIYRLRQSRQALAESEAKLKEVLNASPIPQTIIDAANNVIYLNQAFTDHYGYTLDDFSKADEWWQLAIPDAERRERIKRLWRQHLRHADETNTAFKSIEGEIFCKDGSKRVVIVNATRVNTTIEKNTLIILYDISERKKAEERLKMSGRVFNQAHEGILITDASGVIVDINPAFSQITGYHREEVLGQTPNMLQSGKHSAAFFQDMWRNLLENGYWQGEIWNRKKSGQLFAELLTISTLVDEHGETLHYLGLFSDITQSKEQQQALELMAHYDMLTQLPNRTLFADRFKQAIAHSDRHKSMLAVVFLDLDGFKPVNDRYGHEVGDLLLIEVAQRLKACIREDDTASRLGGDEFVLLLNDISSIAHSERLINRIRHAIELPYQIDDDIITLSASLGITLYPLDNADADTLLRHADQAMYQAKMAGRQRHYIFDTVQDQQASQQQNRLKAMHEALSANQLMLFYQPKVNMRSGDIVGVEALIRWQHPEQGLLAPSSFLAAIEGTELEIHVGNWVIEHALQQLDDWHKKGIETEISINISSHHLQWKGFFDQLEHALSRYPHIPSSLLQLEVLESSVLSDITMISSIISTCRNVLGLRISLDDFGTGYSSLTHLRHLPVDVVKIDQSFVRDIIDDPNDFTIIDGVISLTEAFHHQVIAEGVETIEHGQMLLSMGCELAQGHVIARPMPAADYEIWREHYQPNQQWIEHASKQLSSQQCLIELMRLQSRYWMNRVIRNLQTAPEKVDNWPLMNYKKSHFMHWVGQAKKQNLFTEEWLENLKIAFIELYHEANSLKYQFQEDAVQIDKTAINDLKMRYQIIDELLNEQDHSVIN